MGTVDSNGHLESSAATTGNFAQVTQTVTYVYKEVKGNVVVTYGDTDGNTIHAQEDDVVDASTGTDYNTEDKAYPTITTDDGKTYKLVAAGDYTIGTVDASGHLISSDATTGEVAVGTKTVTYVYQEVKGNVVVHYVDEDGNTIAPDVADTTDASTGTEYDTTDHKPETITTDDGKTYQLVPEKTEGSETGKVVEGITNVTYVYKEVKQPETPDTPNNEDKSEPQTPETDNTPRGDNTPIKDVPDIQSSKVPETVIKQSILPSTGEKDSTAATVGGLALLLGAFGLAGKRRRKD